MNSSQIWHAALSIVADFSPMAYWRMSNGAEFWWILGNREQLLRDRFSEQPFDYSEIVSISVYCEVRLGKVSFSCDWPALLDALLVVHGLRVEELRDVKIPAASVPNHVLRLSVME
jgi:hypothetical protein